MAMKRSSRVWIGASSVIATAVCAWLLWPHEFTYSLIVKGPGSGFLPYKLMLDGREVQPGPTSLRYDNIHDASTDLRLDMRTYIVRWLRPFAPPNLKGRYLSPCGWRDAPVEIGQWTLPRDRQPELEATFKVDLTYFTLLVDNRDGNVRILEVGPYKRTIEANTFGEAAFPAPECPEGTILKLDGVEVGALRVKSEIFDVECYFEGREAGLKKCPRKLACEEAAINSPSATECTKQFLLDTTGKHCYRLREVVYGPKGTNWYAGFDTKYLARTHFHALPVRPQVDYFLQAAPKQIAAPSLGDVSTKGELVDSDCGY